MKQQNKGWLFVLLCGLVLFGSCEEALERPIDKDQVVLLAPGDSLVSTDTSQIFYWETLEGATKYQLQVVTPSFESIAQLVSDTVVKKNQFTMSLTPGQYQWRVRALNNSTTSRYSASRKLIIR